MDPVSLLIAGLAAGLSAAIRAGSEAQARAKLEEARQLLGDDVVPEVQRLAAVQLRSEFAGLVRPEEGRAAQRDAIRLLRETAASGMTPADRAVLDEARREVAGRAQGRALEAQQALAQRGQAGGPMETLATLASAQQQADALASLDAQAVAAAGQRALTAQQALGAQGAQLQQGDERWLQTRAAALDDINRFNASMSADMARYNDSQRWRRAQMLAALRAQRAGLSQTEAAGAMDSGRWWGDFVGRLGQGALSARYAYGED